MLTATKYLVQTDSRPHSSRYAWDDPWGRPLYAAFLDPLGVVNHRVLQADMAHVVTGRARRAPETIPADKLILPTDSAFGSKGSNRVVVFHTTTAIAQARNIVLREPGLEERYVPAAVQQTDATPEHDPLTHFSTLWR